MVIYLDLVFFLNFAADALALYVTSRLSGIPMARSRMCIASIVGGIYGVICSVPLFGAAGELIPQIAVAAFLVWMVFGSRACFLRICLLFFVLSCAMGGVLIAIAQSVASIGISNTLYSMNWKVFFLVGGMCYFFLSVVFHGSAKHMIAGEISEGYLSYNGIKLPLNILLDTGHTLRDPYTGRQVMTVWLDATRELWNEKEWEIFSTGKGEDAQKCLGELANISPGKFWMIPYRSVGVSNGALICFAADQAVINHHVLGDITVALSSTPLSDGGSCNALWGGKINEEGTIL